MNLTEFKKGSKSEQFHYLLFGHPVDHSCSPLMHNIALEHYGMDACYYAIDLESNDLTDLAAFLNQENFLGANITIPYKQMINEYLDDVSSSAQEIEAVNTIVKKNFRLVGYNTDIDGFLAPLAQYKDVLDGTNAIVFGTGGASRAIIAALVSIGLETIYLVSRTPDQIVSFNRRQQVQVISYHEWTSFLDEVFLIVNATPLGMHPNLNQSPVRESEKECLSDRICYDIVYNPLETIFLRQAKKVGATTISGLEMLIQQGSRSFELWTGRPFPIEIVRNTLYEKLGN